MAREVVYKPVEKLKPIFSGGTLTPPKFIPSYYEWLSFKGEQISEYANKVTGNKILYTVPKNFTLFVTTMFLANHCDGGGAATSTVSLTNIESSQSYLSLYYVATNISYNSISLAFPIPFKINGDDGIRLFSAGNNATNGGFTGFLVKNNDIPVF